MTKQSFGLFVGRFQPLHDGHKKCIEHILKKHGKCCVAIRDTKLSEDNPYTYEQRKEMVKEAFPKAKVVKIPDIEVVYIGRDVGYGLIKLDEKIEGISATDLRKKLYENSKGNN